MNDFRNLPKEMQDLPYWAIAASDGSPRVLVNGQLKAVSVHATANLMKFEEACDYAIAHNALIGFVLTAGAGLTCVDMDVCDAASQQRKGKPIDSTKWTTDKEMQRYAAIVGAFDSYAEFSKNGRGIHLWLKGEIGAGCRRDAVEIYSQERFMICTGNVYNPKPLVSKPELLETLVREVRQVERSVNILVEVEEEYSDDEIVEKASNAENGEKFDALCNGKWQELGYPSQSEADLSLLSILCFYSVSNEQCRRLFRYSSLGKREKCVRDNRYLDNTLGLIRARQSLEKEAMVDAGKLARELVQELQKGSTTNAIESAHRIADEKLPDVEGLDWPPGLAGAIAAFIYKAAPRPVKEVAIVSALGLLAGICGKAWHTETQSGLNLYIILVARSAVGKEGMHSGISLILSKLQESIPAAQQFVDFNDFASGPALKKACLLNPSFVNVAGEWGKKLKRFASEDKSDGPMSQLRTVMTDLYQKSGPNSKTGGINYSKKEDTVGSVNGVAYSMIGETTPGVLYDALTENMMEDGFLSRFNIVEYLGDRPPANEEMLIALPSDLTEAISGLCVHALTLLQRYQSCPVTMDDETRAYIRDFDKLCDKQINSTTEESRRQMWNRAHLKVLKMSCLLAVSDNWINPVVNMGHAKWAMDLVMRDINMMSKRINSGDIGTNDDSRERKIIEVIRNYLSLGYIPKTYGIPQEMKEDGIIPRKYIQVFTHRANCFTSHPRGSIAGLDAAIRSLLDNGTIIEVGRNQLSEKYSFTGKAYQVTDKSVFL